MTFPLCIFPFLFLSFVGSVNVFGADDDKKVIYPLRVSSTLVPDRHVFLVLFERNGIQHYTTLRNFSRFVGSQLGNHSHAVYFCKQCLHANSGIVRCSRYRLLSRAMDQVSRGSEMSINSSTFRNNYLRLLSYMQVLRLLRHI